MKGILGIGPLRLGLDWRKSGGVVRLPMPEGLALNQTDNDLAPTWDALVDAVDYERNYNGSWVSLGDVTEDSITDIAPGDYYYLLRGVDAEGVKGRAASAAFTVEASSGGDGFTYLSPFGDDYFQPDGASRYLQPA